jgi:starvation-inducible DNA-binding protein
MRTDILSAPLAKSDAATNMTMDVTTALNGVLADCFALHLKTKNFHWHVSGPHFRDYHLLLDEQATEIMGVTDAIAERVRKIGGTTLRSIGDVARRQTIADNEEAFVPAGEMLIELRRDNLQFLQRIRHARTVAEAAGDTATSSMADDWIDQAEKRAWFLLEASR